jgi:hypothetical protein
MMPFCQQVSVNNRYIQETTYRVVEVLDLLHESEHSLVLAVPNVRLLCDTQTVLGTDAAVPLLNPFVHEGFQLLLDVLTKPSCWDVQVEVGITHVSISDHIDDREFRTVTKKAGLGETISCLVYNVVQLLDGDGEVVLVNTTLVAQDLGDALAPRPQLLDLSLVLSQNAIKDDFRLHNVFQEVLEFLGLLVAMVYMGTVDLPRCHGLC